ncbi:hypothetical protein [Fluviicola taffensis]|uniref:Uncharacterized protein n=1 Tax=Fluviicola taffensis (strain DSM 16823 / NCIMB 13979 / RW262) TaxID=755732 RepID=F2IIG6_FLUTR|nr:hypothetical protein [Fluviicola taffensis]AEA44892.1 hypothetical protein Fluta_2913 [Fluviicola taffensis DSM 16823]
MKKFLFILLIGLAFTSCKKRGKAIWDTDWQVPLVHDSLSMSNLVADSLLTVVSGNYVLDVDASLFEFRLSDFVSLPDTSVQNTFNMSLNITANPGTSFVNNVEEHVIDIGDAQLKKIRVKQGGIQLKVFNPIPTKTFFTITLPGVTRNGVALTQEFVAPAGTVSDPGVATGFVDLNGYELDLTGQYGTSYNRIQSKMLVKSDPDGPSVVVHTTDIIVFQFTMKDVELDYARGYFGNQLVSDTVYAQIDAMNNISDGILDVDAMTFDLSIENGLKVNGKFKINSLKNINSIGNVVSLSHPNIGTWNTINAATGSNGNITASNTTLSFTPGNSNFEQYVENHGAKNELSFQLQMNPWGNVSGGWDEIYDAHPLKVKLNGLFPLNVGLKDLIFQDTFALSLINDPNKTNVKSGQIWINAMNAFPFEGALELYLLDANYQTVGIVSGTSAIESSVFGTVVNGIMQKKSMVYFPVSEQLCDDISKVKHCMIKLKLNTYNGTGPNNQIPIPANAFFSFKLGANLTLENQL